MSGPEAGPAAGVPAYEADFYGWTRQQAALLRGGALDGLDLPNLAEELEAMGRSEHSSLSHCSQAERPPRQASPRAANGAKMKQRNAKETLAGTAQVRDPAR